MNDQPRDPKQVPPDAGTEQPTVEQPTAPAGAADQPATQQPQPEQPTVAAPAAAPGAGEPGAVPAADATAAQPQPGAVPAADQTAVHGQPPPAAPPTPQLSQPGPGQAYGAWGPPQAAQRQPGGFRRFVGHRATQLVGVGVLGLLIGGGIVGGIAAATHHGPQDGRPGIHRQYHGPGGNQGFDGRGPGPGSNGRGGGNSGNSGSNDSGAGI